MIKDTLEFAHIYYPLSENLKKGFEWLKSQDLENIESKKYLIDGEDLYANVQEYETKDNADYEAHNQYIDIQYMIRGKEFVGVCKRSNCTTCIDYDSEKDIEFMISNAPEHYETLNEGEFLILYPQDAHKPSINPEEKLFVKKVVVKVKI